MALILSGTNGITDVNGTAAAPAITGTDTDTGVFFGTNTVSLSTGGTERLQVDSSGNIGIGATPSAWYSSYKALQVKTSALAAWGNNEVYLMSNAYGDTSSTYKYLATGSKATSYVQYEGTHLWNTAGTGTAGNAISFTQAMTLDASGRLGIGQTSPFAPLVVVGADFNAYFTRTTSSSSEGVAIGGSSGIGRITSNGSIPLTLEINGNEKARIDSSGRLLVGYTSIPSAPPSGTVGAVGYSTKKGTGNGLNASGNVFNISWADGLTGAHLWVDTSDLGQITVSSDYRIKKNIESQTAPAIDRLMQLRSVKYELADYGTLFKADGVQREGFIAHELQEIIPSAVDGEKDAENQIQSLRLDALCSVLVKAIQEQQAIIEQLQADVAALKGQA